MIDAQHFAYIKLTTGLVSISMNAERLPQPNWMQQERQADLDWIGENLDVFWLAAETAFPDTQRGAIVVDTTVRPSPDAGNPFACLACDQIKPYADEDTQRMLTEYDPARELVLVLLKKDHRTSTYRVQVIAPEESDENSPRWPTPEQTHAIESEPELKVPDIETLMEWEAEGGCEAACPHGCWVEPDGTCPHGNPSWLLRLGLI